MIRYTIDKLGVTVSRLGFGAMRLPKNSAGKIDYARSFEMVDLSYGAGVNYYDTAYGYHDGESEVFLGEALKKYPRESFYAADKMPMFFCNTESDVERIFDEQRSRMQMEFFDFYMMHALSRENWEKTKKFKALSKMMKKKDAGKIKFFGFSYHGDFETFVEILDAHDWDFVQLQFNYIDYIKLEAKKFNDELLRRNISLIIMEPVRGGFLAGLPEEALRELGYKDNADSAALAFRWCQETPNAAVILSGMSTLSQVKQNIEIFQGVKPLTPDEHERIGRARDEIFKIKTVPCTGCAYCDKCPSEIDIPGIMRLYNEYKLYKNAFGFKMDYQQLGKKSGKNCTGCGTCLPLCPQGIDIPARLLEIDREAETVVV